LVWEVLAVSVNIVLWLLVVLASGYLFVLSTFTLGAMLWAWRDYHRPVASGAAPEGKKGTPARAIVRTGSGNVPAPDTRIAELDGKALLTTQLKPADSARLPDRKPDDGDRQQHPAAEHPQ